MAQNKSLTRVGMALLAWGLAFFFALRWGAVDGASLDLIRTTRLPRALLATFVGMGLSVSGAALQALFTNPLCEPYTLGISAGSALGAVIGLSLGLDWILAGFGGSAFLGALVFSIFLFWVARRPGNQNSTLLLSGVMLGFLGNSFVALWISVSDSNGLQGAFSWLFGDLSRARMEGVAGTAGGILFLCIAIWSQWRDLDGFLMGEEDASALGIDVTSARKRIVLLTSLLIGLCVGASGMIGFIGLVVPHYARKIGGPLHFAFLPLCGIWGAAALTLADFFSRTVARPYELPVGVVTALIGAPAFLFLLMGPRNWKKVRRLEVNA